MPAKKKRVLGRGMAELVEGSYGTTPAPIDASVSPLLSASLAGARVSGAGGC